MMKDKILIEATMLFAEKGTLFSMNELAQSIGLKAPSLYNYYKSKEELLFDIVASELDHYYEYFNSIVEHSNVSPDRQIKKIFYSIIDYYSDPIKARFWRRFGLLDEKYIDRVRNTLAENDKVIIEKLRLIFENCVQLKIVQENINLESTLFQYHMVIQGVISNRVYYDKENPFYNKVIDLAWEGFWMGLNGHERTK